MIIASLKHFQDAKGLNIHAYVIMSNHWHAIVPLEDIMRNMKKFTSKQLIRLVKSSNESRSVWLLKKFAFAANRVEKGANYKVWQDGYHPIHLSSNQVIDQRLDYIHQNPIKAGYVYEPEHYVYSSARDYAGLPGLIAMQMLD